MRQAAGCTLQRLAEVQVCDTPHLVQRAINLCTAGPIGMGVAVAIGLYGESTVAQHSDTHLLLPSDPPDCNPTSPALQGRHG